MTDLIFDYYSKPQRVQWGGSLQIYRSGWRPYARSQQDGFNFLHSLGSFLKPMATSAAKNVRKAVKTVAPVVGKKLVKIGMRSLKDWANQKQLNEAIQANLKRAASETADEYLDPNKTAPPQKGGCKRQKCAVT